MLKPLCFAICPLVVLAVIASGCGSTKTTTTSVPTTASTPATTSTTAGTTVPADKGAQTATQSKGSTHAPQTTTAHAQKQKPVPTQPAGPVYLPHLKSKSVEPQPKPQPGKKYQYPLEAQRNFLAECIAHASKASCECIIGKFEARNVEEGQSMAEMLGIGIALRNGLPLSPRARQYATACKSTI